MRTLKYATLMIIVAAPSLAYAQNANLPWLNSGASQSQPVQSAPPMQQQVQPTHTHHSKHQQQPSQSLPAEPESANTRDTDDRKLNALATEYYHISDKDKKAVKNLTQLGARVHAFHNVLNQRSYGAHDIIKDAQKLENRITARKKKLVAAEAKQNAK